MAILNGTQVAELEVQWGSVRVQIQRETGTRIPFAQAGEVPQAEAAEPSSPQVPSSTVTSTSVGTLRRAVEDGFPAVGDHVSGGAKIAEVEVLGIRNSVLATVDGLLSVWLVEDEAAVEYGQPLAVIQHLDVQNPG
ncbi:MAG: acetyl-CoA carboxylase biotin carboxyl carrier protein [Chloroflexi bacterium]|nr:acetyl-CoA carboxylase biotin carboxyl carrier protein [Chloroflexota bacterium]